MEAACSGGEPWERQQRVCEGVPTAARNTEWRCVDHMFQGGASLEISYPQAYVHKIAGCTCISCRTKHSVEHTGEVPEGEISGRTCISSRHSVEHTGEAPEGQSCYMNLSAGRRHISTHNVRIGDHNTHNSCCCQAFYHAADVSGGVSGGGRLRGMCNSLLSPRQAPQTPVSNCILTPRHPSGRHFVSNSPSTLQTEICAVGTRCSKESIDAKSADQGLSRHGFSSHVAEKTGPQIINADQRDVGMGSLSKERNYGATRALLNQVTLYKWYLRRPNGPCISEVAVGGFMTLKLLDDERVETEPIVERLEKCKLRTKNGVEVKLMGFIDESTTISNGFSFQMVLCFISGFPYIWDHLVVNELSAQSAMGLMRSGLGSCELHGGEVASHKIFKSDMSQKKSGHEVQALGGEKEVPPSCHFAKDISILEVDAGNASTVVDFTSSAMGQENAVLHGEEGATHLQDGTQGEVRHLSKERASGTDLVCDKTDMDTSPTTIGLDKSADTFPNDPNQEMHEIVQREKQICHSNKSLEADICMDNEVQSEVSKVLKDPTPEANLPMSDVGGKGTPLEERPSVNDKVSLNIAVTEEVSDMFLDESCEKTKDVVKHGRQRRHLRKRSDGIQNRANDVFNEQVDAAEPPDRYGCKDTEVEASLMVAGVRLEQMPHVETSAGMLTDEPSKKMVVVSNDRRSRRELSKSLEAGTCMDIEVQSEVSKLLKDPTLKANLPMSDVGGKETPLEERPSVDDKVSLNIAVTEEVFDLFRDESNEKTKDVVKHGRQRLHLRKGSGSRTYLQDKQAIATELPVSHRDKVMEVEISPMVLRKRSSKLDHVKNPAKTPLDDIEKKIEKTVHQGRQRCCLSQISVGTQAEASDLSEEQIVATKHFVDSESEGKVKRCPKLSGKRSARSGCLEIGADTSMGESERKMSKIVDHGREGQHSCKSWMLPPPLPQPRVPVSKQLVSTAFGLKTSRSGRLLVPPLAHWRSQTLAHDMDGGIIAILNGSEDSVKLDTGCFNFKPPAEAQAMRLQKKLCAAATENLTKRKLSGGKKSQNLK